MSPKRQLAGDSMDLSRSKRKRTVPNATASATNQVEVHSLDSCDDIPQADASPAIDMKSWQLPFWNKHLRSVHLHNCNHHYFHQTNQDPVHPALGPFWIKCFLGKPARSSTHSLDIDVIPLGASVSIKLRQKIWCNAYIDLKALLDSKDEPFLLPFQPGLSFCIRAKSTKFPSHSASGLMLSSFFQQSAPNLLKYCHMIREMQYLHGDQAFRMYDENFRKLRETVNVPGQTPFRNYASKLQLLNFNFKFSTNDYTRVFIEPFLSEG